MAKGQFGEPWSTELQPNGWQGLKADTMLLSQFPVRWPAERAAVCVNALDGYDPAKLGDFLEACKEVKMIADKLVRGRFANLVHTDWLSFIDAYDELTGKGEDSGT